MTEQLLSVTKKTGGKLFYYNVDLYVYMYIYLYCLPQDILITIKGIDYCLETCLTCVELGLVPLLIL